MSSPIEEHHDSQAPYTPDPDVSETEPLNANATMGNEELFVKPEGRPADSTAKTAALLAAGVLLVSTWAIVFSSDPIALAWFAFHPTLQTLAIFAFTWGILTLQPTSQPRTKAAGLQRHQLAMILGLVSIILGTSAMIYNKSSHGAPHFTSWHGTFGIIAFAWLVSQFLLGAASVWNDGVLLGGGMRAKRVYKYHRLSGYVLLPLTLLTVNLGGAYADWVVAHSAYLVRLVAYTVAPVVLLGAVYVRVRPSKMKFF